MTQTVILSNNKAFQVNPDEIILAAASRQNLVLEHSCRTGRCGVCKATVLTGQTKTIKQETSLTGEEKASGIILTCCRTATSDLKLDIEDQAELANIQIKTLPCRIDQIRLLNQDVLEVALRVPPKNPISYLPGQYIDVIGQDGIRRSYSIANAQRDDAKITLNIRQVDSGQMSEYWFNKAQVNDLLRLEGPLGTFYLRSSNQRNLVLLATGTGIAPIKAILEKLEQANDHSFTDIYLIWGGRTKQDIYWSPETTHLPLRFIPVLSRADSAWQGERGYVQQVLLEKAINLQESVVYACGSDAMIQSAKLELAEHGLDAKNFYSDAFVSSN